MTIRLMQGNEAIGLGAVAAGCRFFAGYPITPSTEIAELLAYRLPQSGGKFIQMEDEIASMAAVIGASLGGLKAATEGALEREIGEDETGQRYYRMAKLAGPRAKVRMWYANGTELRLHLDGDWGPGLGAIFIGEEGHLELVESVLCASNGWVTAHVVRER